MKSEVECERGIHLVPDATELILCSMLIDIRFISGYTSILLRPANSYVVLAPNLNDFRSLAKKYNIPKNMVGQIKAIVLENGHKYYNEALKDDEHVIKYLEGSQQDDSEEVAREITAKQPPEHRFQSKKPPTVLTIDDIVEKVKQRLFQQMLDRSVNAERQTGDSLAYKNFLKKSIKVSAAKAPVANPVYKSVPMKVIKEEVQFEATYDDLLDKDLQPQIQYSGPNLQDKPVSSNKKFVSAQYGGGMTVVRFVKQVLVPANSIQGQSAYVTTPLEQVSMDQQPSLEPQLLSLMQQPNLEQKSSNNQANVYQSAIMKQLVLMQQQIAQLIRTTQQEGLKKKRKKSPTALEIPQLNIEAIQSNLEIVADPSADDKTHDCSEDEAKPLEEEAGKSAILDEITVDKEQFTEENEVVEDSVKTVENDEDKSLAETKESVSNEEKDNRNVPENTKNTKDTKLDANVKVYTQEFGNAEAGKPIVSKTYNFDGLNVEASKKPVNMKMPVDSARKVMLF